MLAAQLPASEAEVAAAANVARDGYAIITHLLDPALMAAVAEASEQLLLDRTNDGHRQDLSHKAFWTRLLDPIRENGQLSTSNPFVRFAVQPSVLSIVSQIYGGELPQLDDVLLTYSEFHDAPLSYSQLWHRDHDDTRTLKVFIYLTDVNDSDDGPFTFVPGPASAEASFALRSHRTDHSLFRNIDQASKMEMLAPRLTSFIVETSRCYHMGSRVAPGHNRLLYTASFIRVPRLHREPPPRFVATADDDAITKCVITCPK